MLLCDKLSSLLDNQTEMDVMNNVKQMVLGQGQTTIIIVHRLSTMIPECDKIIALNDAMVVKQRNHQELFKKQRWHTKLLTTRKQQLDQTVRRCHQVWSEPSLAWLDSL
jgi:ABC-type multidrug transport system fused ATPase/permease subunit